MTPSNLRRFLLLVVSCLGLSLVAAHADSRADAMMETYTYKTVRNLEIKADLYRPKGFHGLRPVLVWIHGGALMSGSRQVIQDQPLKDAMLAVGALVVSIDYRLAPETKLPEIIADVEDAFAWIRREGPGLFDADPDRIVAAGSSAGGYLTLLAGYRVKPRLRALVSFWGYGDLIGKWYSEPSEELRHQKELLTSAEAYGLVAGPPVSNKADRPGEGGGKFYVYCRQNGIWPQEVSGWDPRKEAEKFHSFMPLENVTSDFPPTMLIHGFKDTDVPCEQSVLMSSQLLRHGVEYRLIIDPEADHGSNWSPEATADIQRAAVEFIRVHLK